MYYCMSVTHLQFILSTLSIPKTFSPHIFSDSNAVLQYNRKLIMHQFQYILLFINTNFVFNKNYSNIIFNLNNSSKQPAYKA